MKVALALFAGTPGWGEVLVLGLVLLLIFGRRLPEVARSLGRSITSFKRGLKDVEGEVQRGIQEDKNTEPEPPTQAPKSGNNSSNPNT